MTFKLFKVDRATDAHDLSIKIHLYRNGAGDPCGWFIGPVSMGDGRMSLPYLPRSKDTRAAVAVVRAISIAAERETPLCLVDPDNLWEPTWSPT